jgi:acetyl esterase/lipase
MRGERRRTEEGVQHEVRRLLVVASTVVCVLAVSAPRRALGARVPAGPMLYGAAAEEEWVTVFTQPAQANAPAVVLLHGGGFSEQTALVQLGAQAKSLQKAGFTVFDVDYPQTKHLGEAAFPPMPEAIERATSWVQAHAGEYGADPTNIEYDAESAGGLLAGIAAEHLNRAYPGTVDAVLSDSGPMDLWAMVELARKGEVSEKHAKNMERALNCAHLEGCSESFAHEWSPAWNVDAATCVPWMLGSFERDAVPISQQLEMVAAARAKNCPIELVVVPGGGHTPSLHGRGVKFLREH